MRGSLWRCLVVAVMLAGAVHGVSGQMMIPHGVEACDNEAAGPLFKAANVLNESYCPEGTQWMTFLTSCVVDVWLSVACIPDELNTTTVCGTDIVNGLLLMDTNGTCTDCFNASATRANCVAANTTRITSTIFNMTCSVWVHSNMPICLGTPAGWGGNSTCRGPNYAMIVKKTDSVSKRRKLMRIPLTSSYPTPTPDGTGTITGPTS